MSNLTVTPKQNPPIFARAASFANRLIEPRRAFQSAEHRQKTRLLAGVLLALAAITLVFILPFGIIVTEPPDIILHIVQSVFTIGAALLGYVLARRGYPNVAGGMLIALGTLSLLVTAAANQTDSMLVLFFLLIVMLFASLFFSAAIGVLVYVVHLVLVLCLPLVAPQFELELLLRGPVFYYTVMMIMCTAFVYLRDHLGKARQQQLARSEARFRAAIDGSLDSFFLLEGIRDPSGEIVDFRIIDANSHRELETGMTREEILGQSLRSTIPALYDDIVTNLARVMATGEPYAGEQPISELNTGRWYQYQVVRVGDGVAVFIHDLTQRKQVEEALRESEKRYRFIFETTSDYAFSMLVEPDGSYRLEWLTESFEKATGYAVTNDLQSLTKVFHPDDLEMVYHHMRDVQTGKRVTADYRIITKSGETRWFQFTRWPELDEQGRIVRYLGVAQEITDRKQAEQTERERERMRIALQTERELNELKNKLMMTISHEFRTPLATIQSSSDLLSRYLERMKPEQRDSHLETIQRQVRHLAEMLDDISFALQNVGSHVEVQPERLDLAALCRTVIEEMHYALDERHSLNIVSTMPTLEILADALLIRRVVRNLISNALKYSPEGSRIEIEIGMQHGMAVLSVRDQGIGISAEEQTYIFQPFFRAANSGFVEGTGIGLSIVKDCVMLHGGSIGVESEVGKGSTFTVRLPLPPKDEVEPEA